MDSLTEEFLKNIQIYLPVEVVQVYNNSLVDVMPLIYNELELPIINQVPIEHLGSDENHSIKFKVEKGHHGIIFLSQLDLSLYMESGEKSKCNKLLILQMQNIVLFCNGERVEYLLRVIMI